MSSKHGILRDHICEGTNVPAKCKIFVTQHLVGISQKNKLDSYPLG